MPSHEDRRGCPPLPEDLTRRPVSISTAAEIGVSRKQLRGALWQRNTRGFYLWAGVDADNVDVRIAQATALLPTGAAIGGWASLYLQGAIDLDGGSVLLQRATVALPNTGKCEQGTILISPDREPVPCRRLHIAVGFAE